MQRVNRLSPQLPVTAYETYAVDSPLATHFALATCEEIDCPRWLNGWAVAITPDAVGQQFDDLIKRSGKKYVRLSVAEAEAKHPGTQFGGALYVYAFEPGQPCFYQGTNRHVKPVGRPDIFSVHGGDHRGHTTERKVMRPQDWQEKFVEHQEQLADQQQRG